MIDKSLIRYKILPSSWKRLSAQSNQDILIKSPSLIDFSRTAINFATPKLVEVKLSELLINLI